jgi:recombination associated protein RdgC
MFRSVRFYSVASPWPETEQDLSAKLAGAAFKPCGPFAERSSGFEPPSGQDELGLARRVGGADLMRLRSQARVLPAAALNEALDARVAEYRARMGESPGRRVKRQLKDQTRDELLPKALLKSERTSALFLVTERVLAIGTASQTRAERFLELLRAALGTLEIEPLELPRPFAELLTRTFTSTAPREFVVARECRMRELSDNRGTVHWRNVDLAHSTVQRCLKDGMEITHLAFEFGNLIGGLLDGNGVLTKLTLAGVEEAAEDGAEGPLAKQDAEIALYGGTLRRLIGGLRRALGGDAPHTIVGTNAQPGRIASVDAATVASPTLGEALPSPA